MESRLLSVLSVVILSFLTIVVKAEPDSYHPTTYTTTTIVKGSSESSYWTIGNQVAVYLVAIPLLLIPLIIIGLKFAERGGYTGHGDGHREKPPTHYKRAFGNVSQALLADLTKRVLDAIKVNMIMH